MLTRPNMCSVTDDLPRASRPLLFSFLDGASQPDELAARAAALGYDAVALTDHDGLSGSLAFAHAAREVGVRPITGCEITLEGGAHLTLLCEDRRGYANLCRLITAAHAHDRRKPEATLEQVARHAAPALARRTGRPSSAAASRRGWGQRNPRRCAGRSARPRESRPGKHAAPAPGPGGRPWSADDHEGRQPRGDGRLVVGATPVRVRAAASPGRSHLAAAPPPRARVGRAGRAAPRRRRAPPGPRSGVSTASRPPWPIAS